MAVNNSVSCTFFLIHTPQAKWLSLCPSNVSGGYHSRDFAHAVPLLGIPLSQVFTRLLVCYHWFSSNVAFCGSFMLTTPMEGAPHPSLFTISWDYLSSIFHHLGLLLICLLVHCWSLASKIKFQDGAVLFSLFSASDTAWHKVMLN